MFIKYDARYAKEYQAILLSLPPSKISAQEDTFVFGSSNVFPMQIWDSFLNKKTSQL